MSVFATKALRGTVAAAMRDVKCRSLHCMTTLHIPCKLRTLQKSKPSTHVSHTYWRQFSTDGVKRARTEDEHTASSSVTISEKDYNALADATLHDILDLLDVLDEIGDDEVSMYMYMYMCMCMCMHLYE